MIRLILIWNIVLTVLLAVLLMSNRHGRLSKMQVQTAVPQTDVLRVKRVEIRDHAGHLTADLGEGSDGLPTALNLFDSRGKKAVTLTLDDRGYGMLYFQSKHTEAKVSVGYFSGNDEAVPLSEEDPEGMWGIRVLRSGFEPPQAFGVQVDGRPIPKSP